MPAAVDEEGRAQLACITLPELVRLEHGDVEPAALAAELRRRWVAGDRREWPSALEFTELREGLAQLL